MRETLNFLLSLEAVWPSPAPRQHGLLLRPDSKPGLQLILQAAEGPRSFLLDEDDMKKPLTEVMNELAQPLKRDNIVMEPKS